MPMTFQYREQGGSRPQYRFFFPHSGPLNDFGGLPGLMAQIPTVAVGIERATVFIGKTKTALGDPFLRCRAFYQATMLIEGVGDQRF